MKYKTAKDISPASLRSEMKEVFDVLSQIYAQYSDGIHNDDEALGRKFDNFMSKMTQANELFGIVRAWEQKH